MSKHSRMNHETVLSDTLLDKRRDGGWFKELGIDAARFRLNGSQSQFITDSTIDQDGGKHFGPTMLAAIHPAEACGNKRKGWGRTCVIHNPSDHGMRGWPLIWDSQGVQMLRLCPHDLEHPDPDDIAYWVDEAKDIGKARHECCRVCFPRRRCIEAKVSGSIHTPPTKASRTHVWS